MKKSAMTALLLMLLCIGSNFAFGQQKTVSGTVKDDTGQGLTGATVTEKGTNNKVITDPAGNFNIRVRPDAILIISYTGFTPREIAADDRAVMSILLEGATKSLNEVVVTSLG